MSGDMQLIGKVTDELLMQVTGIKALKKLPGYSVGEFKKENLYDNKNRLIAYDVYYYNSNFAYKVRVDFQAGLIFIYYFNGHPIKVSTVATLIKAIQIMGKQHDFRILNIFATGQFNAVNHSPLYFVVPVLGGYPTIQTRLKILEKMEEHSVKFDFDDLFILPQGIRFWEENGQWGEYSFDISKFDEKDFFERSKLLKVEKWVL